MCYNNSGDLNVDNCFDCCNFDYELCLCDL